MARAASEVEMDLVGDVNHSRVFGCLNIDAVEAEASDQVAIHRILVNVKVNLVQTRGLGGWPASCSVNPSPAASSVKMSLSLSSRLAK